MQNSGDNSSRGSNADVSSRLKLGITGFPFQMRTGPPLRSARADAGFHDPVDALPLLDMLVGHAHATWLLYATNLLRL